MKKFTFSFLTLLIPVLTTFSASAQTTVSEGDIARQAENTTPANNWVGYTRGNGSLTFVSGPGTTPSGCGSLQLNTPGSADKAYLFNYDYEGTPLSAIMALSYATYQSAGTANQAAAINLMIDYNGPATGGEAVLVFEPVYNTAQGTVTANTWQNWDAFNGGNAVWWSAQAINGVCAFNCFVTWNQIVAANPDAVIMGGFGVNQGSGNPGLISAVDALTISTTGGNTYNFEGVPCIVPIYQPKPNTTVTNTTLTYPNPTSGALNIQVPVEKSSKAEIVIMDATGTIVESRKSKADGQVETFNLSDNGAGLYLIQVITKSKVERGKAIVK